MNKFLKNISKFSLFCIISTIGLIISSLLFCNLRFDFTISKKKNVLILGNSHPECAINDTILKNTFNLAQSGSGYFYDYIKLRSIVKKNKHIDTVVLGYSHRDLEQNMDTWFSEEIRIQNKMGKHFFLFDFQDYLKLLKSNPIAVLKNSPKSIYNNVIAPEKGYTNLGGYKRLDRNKLDIAKKNLKTKKKIVFNSEKSQYQVFFLKKIYTLCIANNIKLILLNTPMHPTFNNHNANLIKHYQTFAKEHLTEAKLIDHSALKIDENYFADLDHLNYNGANFYSQFLYKKGFR